LTPFVLDASIALAWCFRDEVTPETEALLDALRQNEAVVPAVWPLEMLNALLAAERRGRITRQRVDEELAALAALPIRIDGETADRAWRDTITLARLHRLTSYDAAYLELAVRMALPLASRDDALRRAVRAAGVVVFPA
jgi:predicted nucleic acid-binding protein